MGGQVEREFKLSLPGEEALRALLVRLGAAGAPARQENHFFDTRERVLRSAGIALRLRCEDGAYALTVKGPSRGERASLVERPEAETPVAAAEARAILAGTPAALALSGQGGWASSELVRRARELVADSPLVHLGAFQNERWRVGPLRLPGPAASTPLVLELDRTLFPGGRVDHELEVEVPAGAAEAGIEQGLRVLLERERIPWVVSTSKAARFFRALAGS